MKSFAKALTGITLIVLLFAGYLVMGRQLRSELVSITRQPASDIADTFTSVRSAALRQEAGITRFADSIEDNPAKYDFVTVTYEVTNIGLLPAEWLIMEILPESGDIMQVSGEATDLPGLGKVNVSAVLLVPSGTSVPHRYAQLSYYVFGRPLKATAS